MSAYDGYDDEPRRYRNVSETAAATTAEHPDSGSPADITATKVRTRPRERDEPDLVREEVYIERGKGSGPRGAELVYRGRDDSIEDIPRDFPPPGRDSRRSGYDDSRRSKSTGGRRYDDYSDDDRYTDYGGPAVAGAAGYAAGRHRSDRDRDRRYRRDDRDYDSEYSTSPPRRERKKSGVGDLLGSLGLGGLVGGLAGGKKERSRSRSGSRGGRSARSRSRGARSRRGGSSGSSRSRSGGGNNERKWAQAAQAALVAGAVEAFRARKIPGPWTGEKGKRIATAALGAGGIDGLVSGKNPEDKSKRHLAEAVIGGLAINRAANGSRSQVRGDDSRSVSPDGRPRSRSRSIVDRLRGRSQSRGRNSEAGGNGGGNGLGKGLLGAGAAAAVGTALLNRVRSKSRKRRSPSSSSADSYVPSRSRRRDMRRSPQSDTGSIRRTDGPGLRGGQDDRALARGTSRRGNSTAAGAGAGAGAGALAARSGGGGNRNGSVNAHGKGSDDGSDSSSTTDMEKTRKHMRGKEIITASLATVATIHAAHGVYSSMEAHEKRHKLVAEGEMTPEEARKKQTKAWIQDAAAVGIAALGIKGAFSEWKEMNEQRYIIPSQSVVFF